ncbi:hypothetical protein [Gallionella capsiferriformans]|nr:hypothetical protein [Gallionella capsiferriformans]
MKKLCFLLALFPMVASASDTGNNPEVTTKNRLEYSVSSGIGKEPPSKLYYLIKTGDTWKASESGDITQDNVERVGVNLKTGVITLDVLRGSRETGTVSGSVYEWECFQGLAGSGFRNAQNYSICSSNLAKGVTSPGQAALGSLNLLFGKVRRIMAVDREQILSIADTSGLIDMVEQDRQAAIGEEYHAHFAGATTPNSIKSFVATYQANDPEGLVPQALARMPQALARVQQAEIEECRSNYLSATTPAKLNSFIAKYQGNDPENIVPRARKRLQDMEQAAAKNEADRLHRLENKQIGDQVCSSGDGSVDQSTGIAVMGVLQYRKITGRNRVVGFVEGTSGKKVQIRISGINFTGGGINQSLDSLSGWKGGSTLKINSIIWDSTYDWEGC